MLVNPLIKGCGSGKLAGVELVMTTLISHSRKLKLTADQLLT